MCKIRVIIKNAESEILYDEVHEISTLVNPFDRPTYVVMECKDNNVLTFSYTGSIESYITVTYSNDLSISYGKISGRISQYTTIHNRVEGTDLFTITKNLIKNDTSPRFENNIKEGLKLIDSLLQLFEKIRHDKALDAY